MLGPADEIRSISLEQLGAEWDQIYGIISNSKEEPPDFLDGGEWRKWNEGEWRKLCKRFRKIVNRRSDLLEVSDIIVHYFTDGERYRNGHLRTVLKNPSEGLEKLLAHFNSSGSEMLEDLMIDRSEGGTYQLEPPVKPTEALRRYFEPYSDLLILVGDQGTGKSFFGWKLASSLKELRILSDNMPEDESNKRAFLRSLEKRGTILQEWKKRYDVLGVYDDIPVHLKRSDAPQSYDVEQIWLPEKNNPVSFFILPGQSDLRIGAMREVYESDDESEGLFSRLLKRIKSSSGSENGKFKIGISSSGKEGVKDATPELRNAYQGFVLLLGNLTKGGLVPKGLAQYCKNIHYDSPIVDQIEAGKEYIKLTGDFRRMMSEYQSRRAEAVEEYANFERKIEGLRSERKKSIYKMLKEKGRELDRLANSVIELADDFKESADSEFREGLPFLIREGLQYDFYGSLKKNVLVGGLVVTGQDIRRDFELRIGEEEGLEDGVYEEIMNKLASPISLLVPKFMRTDEANNFICSYPVDVQCNTVEDSKSYSGLWEFYTQNSNSRSILRRLRENPGKYLGEGVTLEESGYIYPTKEGLDCFKEKSLDELEVLLGGHADLVKSTFKKYVDGPLDDLFERNKQELYDTVRDFLIATNKFTFSGGEVFAYSINDEPKQYQSVEYDAFVESDAEDIVRYAIVTRDERGLLHSMLTDSDTEMRIDDEGSGYIIAEPPEVKLMSEHLEGLRQELADSVLSDLGNNKSLNKVLAQESLLYNLIRDTLLEKDVVKKNADGTYTVPRDYQNEEGEPELDLSRKEIKELKNEAVSSEEFSRILTKNGMIISEDGIELTLISRQDVPQYLDEVSKMKDNYQKLTGNKEFTTYLWSNKDRRKTAVIKPYISHLISKGLLNDDNGGLRFAEGIVRKDLVLSDEEVEEVIGSMFDSYKEYEEGLLRGENPAEPEFHKILTNIPDEPDKRWVFVDVEEYKNLMAIKKGIEGYEDYVTLKEEIGKYEGKEDAEIPEDLRKEVENKRKKVEEYEKEGIEEWAEAELSQFQKKKFKAYSRSVDKAVFKYEVKKIDKPPEGFSMLNPLFPYWRHLDFSNKVFVSTPRGEEERIEFVKKVTSYYSERGMGRLDSFKNFLLSAAETCEDNRIFDADQEGSLGNILWENEWDIEEVEENVYELKFTKEKKKVIESLSSAFNRKDILDKEDYEDFVYDISDHYSAELIDVKPKKLLSTIVQDYFDKNLCAEKLDEEGSLPYELKRRGLIIHPVVEGTVREDDENWEFAEGYEFVEVEEFVNDELLLRKRFDFSSYPKQDYENFLTILITHYRVNYSDAKMHEKIFEDYFEDYSQSLSEGGTLAHELKSRNLVIAPLADGEVIDSENWKEAEKFGFYEHVYHSS